MKSFKGLLFLLAIVFVFENLFPSDEKNSSEKEVVRSQETKWQSYYEKGLANTWPQGSQSDSINLEEDVTAANYYVVVDGSGSMGNSSCSGSNPDKMVAAQHALKTFFSKIPSDANIGLYAFDLYSSDERLPLGKHSQDNVMKMVNKITVGGGTPLATAISGGVSALSAQGHKQLGYGEYHLVVITDGQASETEDPTTVVKRMLGNTPIVMHTIGFCIGNKHSLNQPGYTLYRSANSPKDLSEGLNAVLAEAPDFRLDGFSNN